MPLKWVKMAYVIKSWAWWQHNIYAGIDVYGALEAVYRRTCSL